MSWRRKFRRNVKSFSGEARHERPLRDKASLSLPGFFFPGQRHRRIDRGFRLPSGGSNGRDYAAAVRRALLVPCTATSACLGTRRRARPLRSQLSLARTAWNFRTRRADLPHAGLPGCGKLLPLADSNCTRYCWFAPLQAQLATSRPGDTAQGGRVSGSDREKREPLLALAGVLRPRLVISDAVLRS